MTIPSKVLVSITVTLALLGAGPIGASAQDEPAEGVSLTLTDCLQKALENNLDLRVARLNPESAKLGVTFQKAAFDALLGASIATSSRPTSATQSITTLFPAGVQPVTLPNDNSHKDTNGSVSIDQTLNFGAHYTVTWTPDNLKQDQSGLNQSTGFPTSFTGNTNSWDLGVVFRLPLLKNFGKEVNTVNVLIAKYNVSITQEDLRQRAESTIKSTEFAYWDVAAARAGVKVAKQSLKLAQDLYDLNKKKVEVGTLAPIEITQAEAGVASREEGVIVAENAVLNAQDALLELMAVPKEDALWGKDLTTADKPSSEPVAIDLDAAVASALEHRPEARSARLHQESQELTARVAKKNTRHELDLRLTADTAKADSAFDFSIFSNAGALASQTHTDETDKSRPIWSAQLVYTYPFGNRAAKANYAIAEANREQAELTTASTEQTIRVDVRTAARAVESGAKRVAAARSNTILQQKTVDAELKKFENGMSTSFEVLRIQTDLTNAQLAEIQALLDYNKSLADLERAKGTLLQAKGLQLSADAGK